MIVDTSALVAVLLEEPVGPRIRETLLAQSGGPILTSAASYLELGIVIDGQRDVVLSQMLDPTLGWLGVELVPVDAEQAQVARRAYRDFGKGSGHPARLNFGDCFSYALASVRREPLLFVGDDFSHTDVRSVL